MSEYRIHWFIEHPLERVQLGYSTQRGLASLAHLSGLFSFLSLLLLPVLTQIMN